MRFAVLIMAVLIGMPSASATGLNYSAKARSVEDDTAIRKAVFECWLALNAKDQQVARTSTVREQEFSRCVAERGVPLVFELK